MFELLLLALVILTAAAGNLLLKYVLKYEAWRPYMILYQLMGALVAVVITQTEASIVPQDLFGWCVVLAGCMLWFGAAACMYKAFTLEDLTQLAALYPLRGLAVFIIAALLLGESITPLKTVGVLIIFVGTVIVSTEKNFFVKFKSRGVQLAILAAAIIGFVRVVDKFAVASGIISPAFYSVFTWAVPGFMAMVIFNPGLKSVKKLLKQSWMAILCCAVCFELSFYFTLLLFRTVEASIVANLMMLGILLTMIASYFLLGERTSIRNRLVGGAVMIVGAVLLTTLL